MGWWNDLKNKALPWKKKKDCCTWWPDGVWQDCCCQHDDDYKYGTVSKQEADKYLKDCVSDSRHPIIAQWMYLGVTIAGWIPWYNHRRRNLKRESK